MTWSFSRHTFYRTTFLIFIHFPLWILCAINVSIYGSYFLPLVCLWIFDHQFCWLKGQDRAGASFYRRVLQGQGSRQKWPGFIPGLVFQATTRHLCANYLIVFCISTHIISATSVKRHSCRAYIEFCHKSKSPKPNTYKTLLRACYQQKACAWGSFCLCLKQRLKV